MQIHVFNDQEDLTISPLQVQKLTREVIFYEGQTCDEVTIHFISTPAISELHQTYFDDPSTTDCISFPLTWNPKEKYRILGDVFVCPKTAQDYVAIHQKEVYEEVALYVIHGLLHLMGYDDIDENDAMKMRQAEDYHMKNIKKKGLLLEESC